MRKKRLERVQAMDTLAYISACGGIEIKDLVCDINNFEDYVVFIAGAWSGNPSAHRTKVYYQKNGRAYFRCYNYTLFLDEAFRM